MDVIVGVGDMKIGGSTILDKWGFFDIGRRNYLILRKILKKENIFIRGEDIGGQINRTLYLELDTGRVWVKSDKFGVKEI